MIIAVDFDGILVENAFPDIGKPDYTIIDIVKNLILDGNEVVLWTSRVDKPLQDAIDFCDQNGLKFAAINDNAPSNKEKYQYIYPNGTRKVYADVYIDDHNLGYDRMQIIVELAKLVKDTGAYQVYNHMHLEKEKENGR